MKKFAIFFTLIFLIFLTGYLNAQSKITNFFYGPDGIEQFEISNKKILVKFSSETDFTIQKQILDKESNLLTLDQSMLLPSPKVTVIPIKDNISNPELEALLLRLKSESAIEYANHFLTYKDETDHGILNDLYVKLNSLDDTAILQNEVSKLNAEVLSVYPYNDLIYRVGVNSSSDGNAIDIANKLHETGLFAFAEPNFLKLLKPLYKNNNGTKKKKADLKNNSNKSSLLVTNDPFEGDQWSLENTGTNTSTWGGVAGADMNVFPAWNTTTGSSTIKVAILDEGVDLVHPDLVANLLPGYDATGLGSAGAPSGDDAHGTACAGIVASEGNNNIGTVGVAYTSKIIPVRIAYQDANGDWVTSNAEIADGIDWAWQTAGADILSNSWGGGSPSNLINASVDGAILSGRGGLGSPVLFAAGNGNGGVSYPASYEPTIAVVAMSMCNERKNPSSCDGETWWGSDFGTGADIAAPGVKIYATDISGPAGYAAGDYTATFNGTSSACPNAAGVMALILSNNPGFTETQARYVIESTCVKTGGYNYSVDPLQTNGTWSSELGYGRVNADAAINYVVPNIDAEILSIFESNGDNCFSPGPYVFNVVLRNSGSTTLTSVDINYDINGGTISTFNWTGSLAFGTTEIISLPSINIPAGSNQLNVMSSNPNGVTDNNPSNDGGNLSVSTLTSEFILTIVFDDYPEETSCDITDNLGNIIWTSPSYASEPDGSTKTETICITKSCDDFVFTIYDSYGDGICCQYGNGSYALEDTQSSVIVASGGDFGASESSTFTNQPETLIVENTNNDGCGSLRAAVASASPGDVITFSSSIDGLPILLTTGEVDIDKDLTIRGNGIGTTIIDGINMPTDRLVKVTSGQVRFENLTVQNGGSSSYTGNGGGLQISSDVEIFNCEFKNNQTSGAGVAIVINTGSCKIMNSIFDTNISNASSQLLFAYSGATLFHIEQCLFINNNTSTLASMNSNDNNVRNNSTYNNTIIYALFETGIGSANIDNNIFSETSNAFTSVSGTILSASNNLSGTVDPDLPTNAGNIVGNPLFTNPSLGDFTLANGSPCFNAGSSSNLPEDYFDIDGDLDFLEKIPFDFDGNARTINGTPDIGAFERLPDVCEDLYPIACGQTIAGDNNIGYISNLGCGVTNQSKIYTLTPDNSGILTIDYTPVGSSVADLVLYDDLCNTSCIQLASSNGSGILQLTYTVTASTTYYLEVSGAGETFDLALTCPSCINTLEVQNTDNDGCGSLRSVIASASSGDVITFSPTINGMPILLTSGEVVIDKDLTISGNGIETTIIDGLNMTNNSALSVTAGANAKFENLTVQNGGSPTYSSGGGGMTITDGNVEILSCQFTNNQVTKSSGSAINILAGSLNIMNSVFNGNGSAASSTVLETTSTVTSFSISQCIFINNTGNELIHGEANTNAFTNNTTWNNTISFVMVRTNAGSVNIDNNIFSETGDVYSNAGATILSASNNLSGIADTDLTSAAGNIIGDPLFTDPINGIYTLANGSPCFNAGSLSNLPVDFFDLDGDLDVAEKIPFDFTGNLTSAAGNIIGDPLFTDPINGIYTLANGSPCFNTASVSGLPIDIFDLDGDMDIIEKIPYDYAGNLRTINSIPDMGVFERIPDVCEDLHPIACGQTITGDDNIGYLANLGCGLIFQSKIYTFTPANSGDITIDFTPVGSTSTGIYLYDDLCGSSCEDLSSSEGAGNLQVTYAAIAGTTYYFEVYRGSEIGETYDLTLTCAPNVCETDQVLVSPTDDVNAGFVYFATDENIIASNVIYQTANAVEYSAGSEIGKSIELNSGFEVEAGAEFETVFLGCNILDVTENESTNKRAREKRQSAQAPFRN